MHAAIQASTRASLAQPSSSQSGAKQPLNVPSCKQDAAHQQKQPIQWLAPTNGELVEAQHVHHANLRQHSPKQVWTLVGAGRHQQAPVAGTLQATQQGDMSCSCLLLAGRLAESCRATVLQDPEGSLEC